MSWSNQKDEFKQYIIKKNEKFEQTTEDEDTEINLPFTTAEVDTGILKAKNSKAPSIDGVIYEVLKNENTSDEIFFNLCFDSHKIPDIWVQSLIYPIPKSPYIDPCLPLNYRV